MPIQHNKGGSTIITDDSLEFFRLAQMRGAVSLECKGMKMSHGPVIWKRVAQEFGIKGNKHKVLAWLEAKIAEERSKQEHVEPDGTRTVGGERVQ